MAWYPAPTPVLGEPGAKWAPKLPSETMMPTGRRPSLRRTGLPSRSSQRSSVATQGLSLTISLVEVLLKQRGGPDGFSRCEHISVAHPHLHPHSSYPLVCRGLPGDPVESLNLSPYFFEEERLGPAAAPPVSRPLFLAFGSAPSLHSPCHAGGREFESRPSRHFKIEASRSARGFVVSRRDGSSSHTWSSRGHGLGSGMGFSHRVC